MPDAPGRVSSPCPLCGTSVPLSAEGRRITHMVKCPVMAERAEGRTFSPDVSTCDYEHTRPTRARWVVTWPDDTFDEATACAGCVTFMLRLAQERECPVTLTPVIAPAARVPS